MIAVADPNWLMSTTAQSAAAFVAIIGGLLVTRVVTLRADKEQLEYRRRELQTELKQVELVTARDTAELGDIAERDFFDDISEPMADSRGTALFADLVAEYAEPWMDENRLQVAYDRAVSCTGQLAEAAPRMKGAMQTLC